MGQVCAGAPEEADVDKGEENTAPPIPAGTTESGTTPPEPGAAEENSAIPTTPGAALGEPKKQVAVEGGCSEQAQPEVERALRMVSWLTTICNRSTHLFMHRM